jgi:HK97 family phage prohead protease/HK97 family phage major capsid protein
LPQVTDVSQAVKDRARGVLDAYFGRMENDEKGVKAVNNEDINVPEPEEDETRTEFYDRCIEEVTDQDVSEEHANSLCALAWENRSGSARLRHKVHAENVTSDSLWTLSDESPDRMGDVIKADGWDLTNFKKNPVALWAHRSDMPPIGRWRDLHIENQSLRGYLELAPAGTSERIDEIRKLVEAGILKAVSVGFKPIHSQPRRNGEKIVGEYFQKQELVETSLVSVPANPNALAVAKSLNLSAATMDLVFGAEHGRIRSKSMASDVSGEHAVITKIERSEAMSTLPQRISEVETQIRGYQDKLTDHLSTVDDSNVSDAQLEATKDLQERITQLQKQRDVLVDSEKLLAAKAANGDGTHRAIMSMNGQPKLRQNQIPTKKDERLDIIVRAGVCQAFSHIRKISVEMARQQIAKEYPRYAEDTTRVFNDYVARAPTDPAMTTVDGWAAELVQMLYADIMELLLPVSVFPKLAALGLSLQFGRAGRISIPTRDNTRSVAGSFVGEGMPIPVRQALFAAQVLTPKKLAVIVSWTREMGEASIPAIEGLLRNAIQEDTAEVIDSTLLDAVAADTIRPAGLLNGVTPIAPTVGGGFPALVQDLKNLMGALLGPTHGRIRRMAFLVNPQQEMSIGLTAMPGMSAFPFQTEIGAGRLLTHPVIASPNVPMGQVIAIDAADFVTVGGEAPRFEVSDSATLHYEDTDPQHITGGTPSPAIPVRSLWQTDSLALRLILPLNWVMRRPDMVAAVGTTATPVTW